MSDEINIAGKVYISSKRAAKERGYAQDYIGQLARSGKIDARRVGGLWFVDMDSLDGYKKGAEGYRPVPPEDVKAQNPKTLVAFDGKEHISASRASEITGYNQDYIGQLARSGKILSRQVGNRWYVDAESLMVHKREKDALLAGVQVESVGLQKSSPGPTPADLRSPIMTYASETDDLIPKILDKANNEAQYIIETKTSVLPADSQSPVDNGRVSEGSTIPIRTIKSTLATQRLLPEARGIPESNRHDISIVRAKKTRFGIFVFATLSILIAAVVALSILRDRVAADISSPSSIDSMLSIYVSTVEPLLSHELIYHRQ